MIPIKLSSGSPPGEFRLFARGWNETEKGRYLFDGAAAKSVMAAYRKQGVDLAIDLEHQSLEGAGPDPTARDARGWFKLELRNGDLWAVKVRWTPDGTKRLASKTQRYISPAFAADEKTQRITKVVNAALTAMPATHNAPALVAASRAITKCGTKPRFKKETNMPADFATMSPTDAHELVLRLATLLGLSPDEATHDAVAAAVDRLFGVLTGESTQTDAVIDPKVVRQSLTSQQKRICAQVGISELDFLRVQAAMNRPIR